MNDKNANWWSDSIAIAARSDVGMRRSNNQDSYSMTPATSPRLWTTRGHVFVVADGMGAHAAGERASALAATIVPQAYLKRVGESPADALRAAVGQAHEEIRKRGAADPAFRDMGTTCDTLLLLPEGALIGHVGDSRVYRVRDRTIEQLTFDHSLLWEVKYSPNAHPAYKQCAHIPKNVITRSLGPTESLAVDLEGPLPLQPGDVFLLCSDGLSGQFADSEIGQILDVFQPEEAAETLVNLANLRGGPDNITVVVVRINANPVLDEEQTRAIEKASKAYEKRPPLPTGAWIALSLSVAALLPALGACFLDYGTALSGALAASILTSSLFFALFFGLARQSLFASKENLSDRRFGKAPYVRAPAAPTSEFCKEIGEVCDQLCEAVREQRFVADWKGVSKARLQANASFKAFDFAGALRANASVVNYLMRELKKNSKKTS